MPRLDLDSQGRILGPAGLITWMTPWPSPDGQWAFLEPGWWTVLHTEVGYEHSVIHQFEDPASKASAFCSVDFTGHITQYGPVGHGWMAWTQVAGNPRGRGVETEDGGDPTRPWTAQQIESLASLVELFARQDGYPIQPTDDALHGRGVIFHSDGGQAWGGHACPGTVRMAQRPQVIARALQIRAQSQPAPPPPAPPAQPSQGGLMYLPASIHNGNVGDGVKAPPGTGFIDVTLPTGAMLGGVIGNSSEAMDPVGPPRAFFWARRIGADTWRINFSGLPVPPPGANPNDVAVDLHLCLT